MKASGNGSTNLEGFFDEVRPAVEEILDRLLPAEDASPAVLHQAMRYSVFAGGKRLRPLLCVAGYFAFRDDWRRVLPVATTLELVHTYSLIHDDLPSMDDDDLRRGIPSCHKVYGEAMAILAGDGLLTLAFETLAQADFAGDQVRDVITTLARAVGTEQGMIAGQVMDLAAEGHMTDQAELESIHRHKTGALLEASIGIGAYLADAGATAMASIADYGRKVGLAFQIVDDILDETASSGALGKTSGKDREHRKATYPSVHGIEASRRMVGSITAQARESARPLGDRAELLVDIADYLENRSN